MKKRYPITPALKINALGGIMLADFRHPYYFPGEFHPFWEMVYVVDGSLQAAGEERVYHLEKGEMILHRPMEFHRLWTVSDPGVHAMIIGFCLDETCPQELNAGAFVLTEAQQQELNSILDYLQKSFPCKDGLFSAVMLRNQKFHRRQLQIFTNLLEIFLLSTTDSHVSLIPKEINTSADAILYREIVTCLNANVFGWISLDEIANQLHCSRSQINRVFSRFSDIGIHKYLLKIKCAQAISLLRKGVSPSDVSTVLSFANQNYFSTVFKRETGMSPTEYLKKVAKP